MLEGMESQFWLWLATAAVVPALIVWFACRTKAGRLETMWEDARRRADEAGERVKSLENALDEARREAAGLRERLAAVGSRHEAEVAAHEENARRMERLEQRFADTFQALSAKALESTQARFLEVAGSTLDARQKAVDSLVKPIRESLEKVDARIGEIETAREGAYRALREQVTMLHDTNAGLRQETGRLVRALRQPVGRGQWGEIQLQRVVELAGMQEHCDFITQASTTTDEGRRLRPDMIVRLPGGKQIVVDAKAPMDAYLNAVESEDDAVRDAELTRHARQVRTHIVQLAAKSYSEQFDPTPEFVVLFLPAESFFSAALDKDPTLTERGIENGVIIATPTTLIALLRAVAYGWRQESLAENARLIAEAGRELHARLEVFTNHLGKLGRALNSGVGHFNSAVGSFERRLLPSARRFESLGAAPERKQIQDIPAVGTLAVDAGGDEAAEALGTNETSDASNSEESGGSSAQSDGETG